MLFQRCCELSLIFGLVGVAVLKPDRTNRSVKHGVLSTAQVQKDTANELQVCGVRFPVASVVLSVIRLSQQYCRCLLHIRKGSLGLKWALGLDMRCC
jgi:hypothetical protein